MTPFKQLNLHEPDKGITGDCFRTCIACLLDLHPSKVPHVFKSLKTTGIVGTRRMNKWLAHRNLFLLDMPMTGDLETITKSYGHYGGKVKYLLSGESPRGWNHVVVAEGSAILHDPHPDGGGLVGPCDDGYYWIGLICVRHPHKPAVTQEGWS